MLDLGNQIKVKQNKPYVVSIARPASNQVRFKETGDQVKNPLNSYASSRMPKVANPDRGVDRTSNKAGGGPNPLSRYDKQ